MRNLGLCLCLTFWALCACEDKRAPAAFTALRGKKPSSTPRDPDDALWPYYADAFLAGYKRGPSGFFGLRGKKDAAPGLLLLDDDDAAAAKRAPSSSFWGMRGKKDYYDDDDGLVFYDLKRAPENRFFGMRGKRQPGRGSFFGMRGKKFDVRGKFVGVRGKKSSGEVANPEVVFDGDRDSSLDRLMYFLSQNGRN